MALYKRGRVWWMRLTHNGRTFRRSTDVTDKRLAEKIHAKVITQIAEEKWFDIDPGSNVTFAELAKKYEAQVFKELKGWQSVEGYLKQLKAFFGKYTLTRITPALIDDFKQMRKAQGVKPATINRQLNILKRMLNLAKKRWQLLRDVPAFEMMPKADNKRVRSLSFEEYHILLDNCPEWLKDLVTVAAWTGLRKGNIIGLKRTEVDLSSRTINLKGQDTKNGERLVIPIAEPAYQVIAEALKVIHSKSLYVFIKADGTPYHDQHVHRAFRAALKKAGIEDFRFHDLRHCFASWNRQAGVDIDTLADLMGHKDTRMTRRYAHITHAHLRGAIELLERSYFDKSTISAHSTKKGASC